MERCSTARRGVALGGFMGAGKSTVGPQLARRLGLPWLDTDAVLVARHGPIDDLYRREGPAGFRARERQVVLDLLGAGPAVLSTGGGVFADPYLRDALRTAFDLVTLEASWPVLAARIGRGDGRPAWDDTVRQRLVSRRAAYADVDLRVDAERPVAAVASDVARWVERARRVAVPVAGCSYDVLIRDRWSGLGGAVARATGSRRVVLVTDEVVAELWARRCEEALERDGLAVLGCVVTPAGERHKTMETWGRVVDRVLDLGVQRSDAIIALGGGVVGDLAGFVASSVLRGVRVVQVPTTLLAMVDSAIGGKVGVDHQTGKNRIGAFHQPSLVWVCLEALETLSARDRAAGMAELIKAAAIGDPSLLRDLSGERLADGEPLAGAIARAIAVKSLLVSEDERDVGRRRFLNLGHTLGHAIEHVLGMGTVRHGEAVAMGLVREAELMSRLGHGGRDVASALSCALTRQGLEVSWPQGIGPAVARSLGLDKKRAGAMIVMPALRSIGHPVQVEVPLHVLADAVSTDA